MYFDVFTIAALIDELMDTVVGGRIQDVIDVDDTGIGLEIYANRRRHYIYASADHQVPRVQLFDEKLRRGRAIPTQLGLLMRRYVEDGILVHASQPEYERVLHLHIDGAEGEIELIIEPMERRSNILLVQAGVILDCIRRVGPEDNRIRLSLPNHDYVPPPPQVGKRDPMHISVDDVFGFFEQNQDPKRSAFQVLSGHLLGMSPLLAREIVFRACGDAKLRSDDADPEALTGALGDVLGPLKNRDWQPGIIEAEELIAGYSVYPVTHLAGWQPVARISDALLAFYGAPVGADAYNAARKPVQAAIAVARAKNSAKLRSLQDSLKDDEERETLRKSGELILAYQYTLEPGQAEMRAQYDPDGPELVIKLDPELSPLDNAQRYFNRYNKAKRALEDVPRLVEETENELHWLDQLEADLEMASNWPDIDEVRQALQSAGYWQGKAPRRVGGGGQSAPLRVVTPDGYVIWVGRNSRQNEIVTFKNAGGEDYWLHARGVPGAHVIIKFDGRRIPDEIIEGTAAIAAYYSKLRNETSVEVDIARVKYVRRIKGAARGMVTYRNEQTINVVPHDESIFNANP